MKRQNRLSRARSARVVAAPEPSEHLLRVAAMGARGDAVASPESGSIYVPYALPGELIRARVVGERAEVLDVVDASPERQQPTCAHFGRCGGCQLQHWREDAYLAWKREQVTRALSRRGFELPVEAVVAAWGEGRRRAAIHAGRIGGRVRLGFIERGGARLLPISQCPALASRLERAVLGFGELAELTTPQRGEITLQCLLTDAGVDVAIKGASKGEGRSAIERLSSVAEALDLARLSIDGELIVERRKPLVRIGRAIVGPPPGAFLQATAKGEEVLAALAQDAIAGARRVVDLFSGIGTFALRAAETAEVLAVEGDADMLAALQKGADGAGGALRQVATLRRDLLRTPLSSLEMKRFDAAIIDPPRSGARLQAEQVARAPVRKLAYVSCDPASFARDLKVLIEHGFTLTRITPVDQFRWSPHVELVGALER